jgi:two-component system, NtrC family, response regulator AtoC
MTQPGRILIIDDHEAMREVVVDTLAGRGFAAEAMAPDVARLTARLATDDIDVVLTDLRMPGLDGLEVVRRCGAARPDVPVVLMTAFGSLEAAVDAMRAGAWDFVQKPIDGTTLQAVLERALKHRRLTTELRRLQAAGPSGGDDDMVAGSPAMRGVLDVVGQVAPLDVTVLITGESGTGKEVAARALHARSSRRDRPFVAVNCAALPEALLESQLFGHVRGAFTDAHSDRAGLFAEARGGTILLDEFGELPLALQPKLLRALQERTFRPVGGTRDQGFDARIVVATNRPLEQMVQAGRFREDLFYRVNVVSLELPPLRARPEDILPLAHLFLQRAARRLGRDVRHIDPAAAELLLGWEWPGNVRELGNAIERAVALTRFDTIVATDLPERLRQQRPVALHAGPPTPHAASGTALLPLEEVERRHILAVLHAVGDNRGRAASILGIDPKTLYRKLRAWSGRGDGERASA